MARIIDKAFGRKKEEPSVYDGAGKSIKPMIEAARISLIYGLIGTLWILLSDRVLGRVVENPKIYMEIQTYKGWFYVLMTMIMVYVLLYKRMRLIRNTLNEVNKGYEEISSTNEELIAIEEELRQQFGEVEKHRNALLVSDQRYKLVVEGANDGIWDWDLLNDIYYFSLKWKSTFGYEDEELSDSFETWKALLHPLDRDKAIKEIEEYLLRKKGIYQNTYRLRCKDGRYRWILSRGKGIWDEDGSAIRVADGSAIRVAGSHTDITDLINLQEHLKQEKNLSDSVINYVSVIVSIWDSEGRILRINPYAKELLGYEEEEVVGKKWIDFLIPEEDKNYLRGIFEKVRNGQTVRNHESRLISKDGQYIDILWNSSALHKRNGVITEIISIGADITKRKLIEGKLHRLAYYDTLTELPNRPKLEQEIDILLKNMDKESKLALIYMDIDNFKHINDTLGHLAGDKLLKDIADILKNNIKSPNLVARLSGDEFAIVFSDVTDKESVIAKIKEIIKVLRRPWRLKNQEFFISYSIGIALYPDNGKDLTTLLKNADTAMFEAKAKGRDRYCFYSSEIEEKTSKYINTINELRYALDNKEFSLYYQPQIHLETGEMIGLEALIRWNHPQKGFISPITFIPIAEEAGLIHEIGKWVIKEACSQKKRWEDMGYSNIKMSINISGKDLEKESFPKEIEKLIASLDMGYKGIQLEITETSVMGNLETSIHILKRVRKMGVSIAMDDFGTGYSSLTYLKKLPIDVLKMDRHFINNLENDIEDEAIVQSVIGLAHGLNIQIVAEGIETEEQLTLLRRLGCNVGQGYLFSKPVPPEDIEKMIKTKWRYPLT